ncbi:hypothetical protein, partial [Metabacillus lacus]|uniref:hypothetical protein n=1 Tax=Metabacillus lacus TaxID=1983721 RepID=UPI001BA5D861
KYNSFVAQESNQFSFLAVTSRSCLILPLISSHIKPHFEYNRKSSAYLEPMGELNRNTSAYLRTAAPAPTSKKPKKHPEV